MSWQNKFIKAHSLTNSYTDNVQCIIDWLLKVLSSNTEPICLAINGAQGSGKSTLASYLKLHLESLDIAIAVVSLDDFYLSKADRNLRTENYHALFATRGVPGTHNIEFAINELRKFKQGLNFKLPLFNKALDEPYSENHWQYVHNKPVVLIFEGWCVGLKPQPPELLPIDVNEFEKIYDADGQYRQHVNAFLSKEYQTLFSLFDKLLFLDPQSFDNVYGWRLEQEHQLIQRQGRGMSNDEVLRFIQYFERLTNWGMSSLSSQCNLQIKLDKHRQYSQIKYKDLSS